MHDVQIQIRCQRCGNQMELKDPGPDDSWPPQQFWECLNCGRHFWTTYPPPKKPAPPAKPNAIAPKLDAGAKETAGAQPTKPAPETPTEKAPEAAPAKPK